MNYEAVILAGGYGTRLTPVVSDRPKPMADVGGSPFLEYLLNYLLKQEILHTVLAVGYKAELIRDHFGDSFQGMKLSYAFEYKPLGTGGAILNAIKFTDSNNLFVLNGDTFFPVSLKKMKQEFLKKNPELIMALRKENDTSRFGTVLINQNLRIIKFEEKNSNTGPGLINGGIYLIDAGRFMNSGFPEKFSFEEDYLKINAGNREFYGIIFDEYFIDIGIPETYLKIKNNSFDL